MALARSKNERRKELPLLIDAGIGSGARMPTIPIVISIYIGEP